VPVQAGLDCGHVANKTDQFLVQKPAREAICSALRLRRSTCQTLLTVRNAIISVVGVAIATLFSTAKEVKLGSAVMAAARAPSMGTNMMTYRCAASRRVIILA